MIVKGVELSLYALLSSGFEDLDSFVAGLVTGIQRKLAMRLSQLARFLCFTFLHLHGAPIKPSILPFLNLSASLFLRILDLAAVVHLATSSLGMLADRFLCFF